MASHQISIGQSHHSSLATGVSEVEVEYLPELPFPFRSDILKGSVLLKLEEIVVNSVLVFSDFNQFWEIRRGLNVSGQVTRPEIS